MDKNQPKKELIISPEITIRIYCGVGINGRGEFDESLLDTIGEVWYVATR